MKSTITRERLQEIAEDGFLKHGESKELARMALAAMDSEPVGEFYEDGPLNWYQISDGDRVPAHRRIPLYRHAQPAPVVPEEWTISDAVKFCKETGRQDAGAAMDAFNACRAAMLQAQSSDDGEPTDDERIMAIEGIIPPISAGNSPVIPDGSEHCPCCGKKLRRACSVEGCEGKHVAHGLCKKHYDMKRWEDPEQVRKFREAGKRYRRKTKSAAAAPQEVKNV